MDFIEGAAYGMSAAFIPIYMDFTLTEMPWPTANGGVFSFHRRCTGPIGSAAISLCNVAVGSIATEPFSPSADLCPLLVQ
jgi:hypothetical protein